MAPGTRPTGTVTFLFTDIEGSTHLWDTVPEAMAQALERHDAILKRSISDHEGSVFATGGDGFCVAFPSAGQAVAAASDAQRALTTHSWASNCVLRVRMGIHAGEAVERGGDYFGPSVNLAARVMSAAHGGQIVCTDVVTALTRDAHSAVPLGEHELRGVTARIGLHQLTAHGLPTEFGPLRTVDVARTNLPYELAPAVGRGELITQVCQAISSSRLVTLTGVGGVGKTTVGINVGRRLTETTRQGVWLIELAAVSDPNQTLNCVAGALRFSPPGGTPLREALAEYLTGRDLILILDNCEQIIEGAAESVRWLLQTCPTVRILATSREALGLSAERVVVVPPLDVPDRDEEVDVITSPAGELFLARASDAGAKWKLDQQNAADIARLCRSLDGIPLALELAAARTAQLSVEAVASRLGARLDVLSRGRRTGEARHQSLVAALEWSYELLALGEQALLRRLAVFFNGFDVDGVVAVAASAGVEEWDALDGLSSLVAKSLVELDSTTGRYRLLETVRAFAVALSKDDEATAQAHAKHFLAVLSDALGRTRTTDGVEATEILVGDAANVEAALVWCAANGRYEDAFRPFSATYMPSLMTMPITVTDALVRPLERLLLQTGAERTPGFSAACAAAAMLVMEAPERERLTRIVAACQHVADDAYTALCKSALYGTTGDNAGGAEVIRNGLPYAADPLLRASMLGTLVLFESAIGSSDARSHAEEALALARSHGGSLTQVWVLAAVADSCQDDVSRCVAAANEASRLDRSFRRTWSSIAVMFAARAAAAAGNISEAVPLLSSSIAQMRRAGSRLWLAVTVGGAADAIAGVAPDAAVQLACLAESGAIKDGVGILNVWRKLRDVTADKDPAELDAMRAEFAVLNYDEAVDFVLSTLDNVAKCLSSVDGSGAT